MPVSDVNGVALHWQRSGAGVPLLYCNGSGSTLADAQPMLAALAAGEFDLLAFDYRGLGQSGPAGGPYTMADVAEDVAGLLDVVGWSRCRIVGVSFGGMVAQEFAVTHPERVERLALACTSPGGDGGSSYPLHSLAELSVDERVAVAARLSDTRWDETWLETHAVDRALAEHLAARQRQTDPPDAAGRRAQIAARAGHDVWDRLGAVNCPTLVAYGRYDGIAPPQNSEAIASRIPGADLRGYEGGHMFLFQDPAAMRELVTFLEAGA
jgi:3-oxoadipate enol-lactonase